MKFDLHLFESNRGVEKKSHICTLTFELKKKIIPITSFQNVGS